MERTKGKSVALAIVAALFVWGLGHIYVGKIRRGSILLIGWCFFTLIMIFVNPTHITSPITTTKLFGSIAFVLAGFYIWIRQIKDAWDAAREYNRGIASKGIVF